MSAPGELLKLTGQLADELRDRLKDSEAVSLVLVISDPNGWASAVRGSTMHALIALHDAIENLRKDLAEEKKKAEEKPN